MVRTLWRLFEKIPASAIFWSFFAWLVWKLVLVCLAFQTKGEYFYIALPTSVLIVGVLIFGSPNFRYRLIIPALIAVEVTKAAIPLL